MLQGSLYTPRGKRVVLTQVYKSSPGTTKWPFKPISVHLQFFLKFLRRLGSFISTTISPLTYWYEVYLTFLLGRTPGAPTDTYPTQNEGGQL